uniref:Uncharacterized protein n=1 Tax=viral metagenome TaxID=1070528 RepID=A0A6H2A5L4_9ZZZZ
MKKQSEAKPNNKIFTDSIFNAEGKDYNTPRRTDWNKVFEKFAIFIMIFAVLYFGLHLFAFVVYQLAS